MRRSALIPFATIGLVLNFAVADDVKFGKTDYYETGLVIGRPLRAAIKGLIFDTMEMSINHGGFVGSNQYAGTTEEISTKKKAVFEKFKKLDPNKMYIFDYERPHMLNPVLNETHYLLRDIREVEPDFSKSKLPKVVEIKTGRRGNYARGEKTGVIIGVERWGNVDATCSVELNLGGHSADGKEQRAKFAIYGEKNCKYVESLLPYGMEVKVGFTEDTWEMWDLHDRIIERIEVIGPINPPKPETPAVKTADAKIPTAIEEAKPDERAKIVEEVRQKLMKDPEFIKAIQDELAKNNKKNPSGKKKID